MKRTDYCVIADDAAGAFLAAACSRAGTTVWIRGFEGAPSLAYADYRFPLLPPVSLCAGLRDGFQQAKGVLRAPDPNTPGEAREWALHGDTLAFLRLLESGFPDQGPALIDLYRRIQERPLPFGWAARDENLPAFLHPLADPVGMVVGHTPIDAAPFSAFAHLLRRWNPGTYSPGQMIARAEQEVTANGGLALGGAQVDSVSRGGREVHLVEGESFTAGQVFLGNSEYLWRRLAPFSSELFPFLGYGMLKHANTDRDFVWQLRDLRLPPVERNLIFGAIVPWAKGEAPFGERRVIFGVLSSAFYWRKRASEKTEEYRAFLEHWAAEHLGDVKMLGWLTPPEVAVHPLRFTVPSGSFLSAEWSTGKATEWRRSWPQGVQCLIRPGYFTGEVDSWLVAAEAAAARLPSPKQPSISAESEIVETRDLASLPEEGRMATAALEYAPESQAPRSTT